MTIERITRPAFSLEIKISTEGYGFLLTTDMHGGKPYRFWTSQNDEREDWILTPQQVRGKLRQGRRRKERVNEGQTLD